MTSSRLLTTSGTGSAGNGLRAPDRSAFIAEIARIQGIIHFIDPTEVDGYQTNGTSARAFKDRASGAPLRSSPSLAPVIATEANVANGLPLFDVSANTECDLSLQNVSYPLVGLSYIGLLRPVPGSINGTNNAYILRAIEMGDGGSRLSFLITAGGTPTLLLRDDTANAGIGWAFGSALVAAKPVVIGFTMDFATKKMALYCNDGSIPVAANTVSALGSYPAARFTFFGAKNASGSWRGRGGYQLLANRALLATEIKKAMQLFCDLYDVRA
jgi:hypothetical protein